MPWKFNTLTEQFSLWSTLWPRNLAVESLICHYPGFYKECGMWLVWREKFLSAAKETSEHQVSQVAQRFFQTSEMPDFYCKQCWGTINDHSCEGLRLLFHRRHDTFKPAPLSAQMRPWVWGRMRSALPPTLLPATLAHPPTPCCHPEVTSVFWVQM